LPPPAVAIVAAFAVSAAGLLAWPAMRREIQPGYELDDDRDRMDVDAIHDYLSNHAYWALGRSRETVQLLLTTAFRVVGLFHHDRQVGFCRAISDGAVHAYLADVYVLDEHRGKGLGVAMVQEMVEGGGLAEARWMLHTRDAQTLYHRFGFGPAGERVMERVSSG
jgi:GNAT superfamily N-acetyltransferase